MINLKDEAAKGVNFWHQTIFMASEGRLLGRIAGMPAVAITTVGRKSGKRRRTMLTTPIHDDDQIVLIASYGGDDRHPAWFLNLRDNPDVEVTMGGKTRKMVARIAPPDEKAELWPRITDKYSGYAGYQKRTDRDIPVVILEPAS